MRTAVRRGGQFCCKFTSVHVRQKLLKYNGHWSTKIQGYTLTIRVGRSTAIIGLIVTRGVSAIAELLVL